MQAMVHTRYGAPTDVLHGAEVDKPQPHPDEVLVEIHASSINFGDRALVRGKPLLVRFMGYGVRRPKHPIPGGDIAGRVAAVGANVTQWQPGDAVFADIGDCGLGAYAEYVAVPAEALTRKPANLSFAAAASVPQAAVVALQGLRDKGEIAPGDKVLINGASGGVGHFAVQIAKAYDADVTGVCSTRHVEMVRNLGADHVIDYTQADFTQLEQDYDLIFDIVANRSTAAYVGALTPTGRYVACAFNPTSLFLGPLLSKKGGKQVRSLAHKPKAADLATVRDLIEAGQVTPVVNRCFPLGELAAAMGYLDGEKPCGKVVIIMKGADRAGRGQQTS